MNYKNKYRSHYEQTIGDYLHATNTSFKYEPYKISYLYPIRKGVCTKCGGNSVLRERTYKPDFVLLSGIIIEAKGKLTSTNRTSMLWMLDTSGKITRKNFRLLLMSDNTYGGKGKRYSDWCISHDIEYAVSRTGEVPRAWLKENNNERSKKTKSST